VRKKLGECLIQSGLITDQDLQVALAEQKRTGERVGAVLVRLNLATEKQITKALAYQLGFPFVSLSDDPPERAAIALIPKERALEHACVAVRLEDHLLTVAIADPLLVSLVQELEAQTGCRIKPVVATRSDILESIQSGYPERVIVTETGRGASVALMDGPPGIVSDLSAEADSLRRQAGTEPGRAGRESEPMVDLVELVLKGAITSRASDVHIEPMEEAVLVRYRLDGVLKNVTELPTWAHEGLVARIKGMAGMDIDQTRLPQDGCIRIKVEDGRNVGFRVSTLRTLFGEKVALRGLDHAAGPRPLEELGLSAAAMEEVRRFLRHQHGMILVVGPRGSGTATTLSSAIATIRSGRINITTVEDPIEYQIPGVNQTTIDEEATLTFASALRAILRQDPDVVLVGELRDEETATIAIEAAQAGRLVLSRLHTDTAAAALTRLVEMVNEPYAVGSALVGVIAQRLVRRLCLTCRRQCTPDTETLRAVSIPDTAAAQVVFYKAVGCDECNHTGYRGRTAVFEVMPVTDRMRRLIAERAGEESIREAAIEAGIVSLGEDGLAKVKTGVTTAEELLRVVTDVREIRTLCTVCSGAVASDFQACPHCGHRLDHKCPKCSRALQPGWIFCPYCSSSAVSKKKKKPKGHKAVDVAPSNVAEFKNQNR
jgi:type IV pilus assembly protein PilB